MKVKGIFIEKLIDRRIAAYQSELLATHYAEVENMYRKMRGWRHDYRNHIQVLKSYADMGALDELRRYLDELGNDLDTVDLALKTGNKNDGRDLKQQDFAGKVKGNRCDSGRPCGGGAHHSGD